MNKRNKLKILNDPIYGFITIPSVLIFDLIEHKYFQRLRRITQMGLSYLVYPGAHHTRFHHAIGCMHLMQKAVRVLRSKGVSIDDNEEEALYVAILLHDIGHGPFSHAMEHSIVSDVNHETISLQFMKRMNLEFNGSLTLAIEIFTGAYHRAFLHQLISGQLDMDRLDYLKRDSFYTGVAEGNINSERLITMLNVVDQQLVVEEKGIYSVETFLLARRLMYWQVYLHKTSLVAEQLLIRVLMRSKQLKQQDHCELSLKALSYFLDHRITSRTFTDEVLDIFARLDDNDIISALKEWSECEDLVLKQLSTMILHRDLLKIEVTRDAPSQVVLEDLQNRTAELLNIHKDRTSYFVFTGKIENQAYHQNKQNINILYKNQEIKDIVQASDGYNLKALSKPVTKYYLCYPKELVISQG